MPTVNPVIEKYSALASAYDEPGNIDSCWGRAADSALRAVTIKPSYKRVVDVGCGTGRAIAELAARVSPDVELIGFEPAENMMRRAQDLTAKFPNVRVADGRFEDIPLPSASVDYMFSILAFHWTTDLEKSVAEIARVLTPTGEADLMFIGRHNGKEFIKVTTPVFLRYMGMLGLVKSTGARKQLTRDAAAKLFDGRFGDRRCEVEESYTTYFDTLEGHWSWWVRIEGQMIDIPDDKRATCDEEVKAALAGIQTEQGVPYTIHLLHVKIRNGS
jgi:ubiquinone/menaquinone biosynthesis C-methylase UbiE